MGASYYIDERTGRVHIIKPIARTHEECVRKLEAKKKRNAQKAARRRNRR